MTYSCALLKDSIVSKRKAKLDAIGLTAVDIDGEIGATTVRRYIELVACYPQMHAIMSSVP
jgi:hypothetical protein